ncbi:ABC transporter ATP-binding protein [Nocardia suismassiliense]|uniref:ABC transporter ATP-binding protein n=1 Tax=Nocardia suismassiliense TaxID=2077092 RepID=A0ABW6QXN5_9NOCA
MTPVSKDAATLPVADRAAVRRAAWHEIRADRTGFAVMLLLNALAAAAGLAAPRLLGAMVDTVKESTGPGAVSRIDELALAIVAFTLIQLVLTRFALYAGARFGEGAAARIRERYLDRTLALPASTVEHVPTGDLVTRGTSDVGSAATALRDAAPEVLVATVQAVFIIAAVMVLHPLLGVCALTSLIGIAVALRWYLRRARTDYLTEGAATAALADILTTTAHGARTIEAFGLHERRRTQTDTAIAHSRRTRLRTLWLRSVLMPSVDVSQVVALAGVLFLGGMLERAGLVSLGTVIAAVLYLRQLSGPLDTIMMWIEQLQQSSASYARVEGLAQAPSDKPRSTTEPADDRIEVADCHFAYTDDRDVLHGVTLDIAAGEKLAIVGPSGAGKTTLGRLLAGLEEPRSGTVSVGGVPIADLAPELLRRQVVLVTQEHHVFQDTLRGNLRIADPTATDERMRDALTTVDARWALDLPDGLDTELGGAAHTLNGAQAQQLALARVALADPHTLILDEATALLDPASARATERALAAVLAGRTVIAIAHRLHTAHDADRIVVMADGSIIELGTHDELVAEAGIYAGLWRSWHGD